MPRMKSKRELFHTVRSILFLFHFVLNTVDIRLFVFVSLALSLTLSLPFVWPSVVMFVNYIVFGACEFRKRLLNVCSHKFLPRLGYEMSLAEGIHFERRLFHLTFSLVRTFFMHKCVKLKVGLG